MVRDERPANLALSPACGCGQRLCDTAMEQAPPRQPEVRVRHVAQTRVGEVVPNQYAFNRRHLSNEPTASQLLAAKDPVLRAHAARGLAFATLADASGRLASAYAYETDETVRRALVEPS